MTIELAALGVVNAAYFAVGAAAFVAAGWVDARPRTWRRLGAAYLFGVVICVVPASYLALAEVPAAWTATAVGAVVVGAGAWRGRRFAAALRWPRARLGAEGWLAAAITVATIVVLGYAARTFVTRPLLDWDAWAIWASKARLLYSNPTAAPAALRSGNYAQTPYPLGLPTLQALGFDAMGKFDGTVIGAQFLALAGGFVGALWSVLDRRARPVAIALVALVVVSAPQILYQLLTHYADVPLGLFVGVGVAAGAAWTASPDGDGWLLACFAGFLGMAGLTKSEGLMYAAAAAVALLLPPLVARERSHLAAAARAVVAVVAILAPWRIYCSAYGLSTPDYDLANVANVAYLRAHTSRVHPVVSELWSQLDAPGHWGYVVEVAAAALVAALLARRYKTSLFAVVWIALSAVGLVLVYWVSTLPTSSHLTNSSYRTIVSLIVGAFSVVPVLVSGPRAGDDGV